MYSFQQVKRTFFGDLFAERFGERSAAVSQTARNKLQLEEKKAELLQARKRVCSKRIEREREKKKIEYGI